MVDEISIRMSGILRRCGEVEIDMRNCPMVSLVDVVGGGVDDDGGVQEKEISSPSK